MPRVFFVLVVAILVVLSGLQPARTGEAASLVITPQQIEADWLKQDEVPQAGQSCGTTGGLGQCHDAARTPWGCDGIVDGAFGFHTGNDDNPWWQVDLGDVLPLEKAGSITAATGTWKTGPDISRSCSLEDGKTWKEVYQHNGTLFRGQPDGKPLVVSLKLADVRFSRVQLPGRQYLHLDEIEVFRAGSSKNIARGRPADQSSVSLWSVNHPGVKPAGPEIAGLAAIPAGNLPHVTGPYPMARVVLQGVNLAENLRRLGANVGTHEIALRQSAERWRQLPVDAPDEARRKIYFQARWAVRRMALANPLLDFDDLLFAKRAPGSFTHMWDQYYGWFSRPGGGLYVLERFKTDAPRLRCLTREFPPGSVLATRTLVRRQDGLFAYCKYYPGWPASRTSSTRSNVPEDAFYHLYEINLDGTGLRRLTHGKYDDFDGRYLPDGQIVFLSTRRGQYVQCGTAERRGHARRRRLPDSYVRCGGVPPGRWPSTRCT